MYVDSIVGMLNFGICDSLQPAIRGLDGVWLMASAAGFAGSILTFALAKTLKIGDA